MAGQGPVARAVTAALKSADVSPRDEGAVQLAKSYAALIDSAAPTSVYAKHLRTLAAVLALLDDGDYQGKVDEAFRKISDALSAHSVASDLGPKLLAVLTALGMTVAGRGVKAGGSDGPRVPDELAALRERAQDRRAR